MKKNYLFTGEEGSPYIDFESYARATEEAEVLRARAERAEAALSDAWRAFGQNVRDAGVTLAEAIWAGHRELEDKGRQHAETIARAEKAEAEARVARNETAAERELYEQMHDQVILFRRDSDKWAADAAEQTARAEKYLAAAGRLTDAMRTGIVWKPEIWAAYQALEKIVEEARNER